jgi:SWI/SNF-related matrix-associated actin-dependent regulator 1 of chromatin subfamily A
MPTKTLFDWQKEDGLHMASRRSGLIGHEPRVGKSGCSIHAADVRAKLRLAFGKTDIPIVVIVCPANVRNNWDIAIDEFRSEEWIGVIVSWAKAAEFNRRWRAAGLKISVLIIDEAHYAKEQNAARTKAVYGTVCDGRGGLSELADAVYCLTGTPLPNNPTELWPMLRALAPELITLPGSKKPLSASAFRDRYCAVARNGFGGLKIKGARRYGELKDILKGSGFMLRRYRRDVFGRDIMPPTTIHVAAPSSLKEIKQLEGTEEGKEIRLALEQGGLKALAKMKGATGATLRRLYGLAKVPGLASLIADELDQEPTAKIIVGAWHLDVIRQLTQALKKYGAVSFTGSLSPDQKVRVNEKFQRDPTCRVVVGQIVAMGVGLDFSAADDAIFAEQSWVGDENEQFRSRIFNVASLNPKFTRFAVLPGTMDVLISAEAERKLRDARKILD